MEAGGFGRDGLWYEDAGEFVARVTRGIEREFGRSHPRPRNRRMGFRGERRKGLVVRGDGWWVRRDGG